MAKQSIGLGSVADDGTGDTLRIAGDKVNDNFDEIYTALGDGSTLTTPAPTASPTFTGTITAVTADLSGDLSVGDDLSLDSDGAVLNFGANSEVNLTHVHDKGLILKHTATTDDKPVILTLQTGETDMAADDVMGKIEFQAPDEGTGTDAILVAAAIQARAEGDFSSSSNATSLDFMNGSSEAAATKMTLTSAGNLGLGDSSPGVANGIGLQIHNSASAQARVSMTTAATGSGNSDGFQLGMSADGGTAFIENRETSGSITLTSGSNLAMTIASTGIVTFSQIPALPVNSIEISTTTRGAFLVMDRSDGFGSDAGDNIIDETDSDNIIHESATDLVGSVFNIIDSAGMVVRTINSV